MSFQEFLLNVKTFGAVGDGVTNDTAAVQKAITAGANAGQKVFFPQGTYLVDSITQDGGQGGILGESMWSTIIKARSAQTTLVSLTNLYGTEISNITFDPNGLVGTCLDTSWSTAAPSISMKYSHISFAAATWGTQAWKAQYNNDTTFESIVIPQSTSKPGLVLNAPGGDCRLTDCTLFSRLDINCQNISIKGGVVSGINVTGSDDNNIEAIGTYWYADPSGNSLNNLNVSASGYMQCCTILGGRVENGSSSGFFFGGSGSVNGGILCLNAQFLLTGSGVTPSIVQSTLQNTTGGYKFPIEIRGGVIEPGIVVPNHTNYAYLNLGGTNIAGTPNYTARFGGQLYTNLVPWATAFSASDTLGNVGMCTTQLTANIASGVPAVVTGGAIPNSGILILQPVSAGFPTAVYAYNGSYTGTPVMTLLSHFSDSGGGTVTATYSSSAVPPTGPSFSIQHNSALGSTFYKCVFFGSI